MIKIHHFILASLAALVIATAPAMAQRLPDSVFNNGSQAFGNTLQDVPPDVISVETSPAQPVAGERVWVRAVIQVDPAMSPFIVNRAKMFYSTDRQQYTTVEMQLVDPDKGLWQAPIPGFDVGVHVDFAVAGWDEVGNAVFQIPLQNSVSRQDLFKVIEDENDTDIPEGLDILTMSYGTDGDTMYYCQTLEGPFQTFTLLGASADAMGIYRNDVRFFRHRSYSENNDYFIAYIPAFEVQGPLTMDNLLKGSAPPSPEGIEVMAKGDRVCSRSKISSLDVKAERGIKVFSGTVAVNPGNEQISLVDFSPYAIIYFGGNSYEVK